MGKNVLFLLFKKMNLKHFFFMASLSRIGRTYNLETRDQLGSKYTKNRLFSIEMRLAAEIFLTQTINNCVQVQMAQF